MAVPFCCPSLPPAHSELDLRNLFSREDFSRSRSQYEISQTYAAALTIFVLTMSLASQAPWVAVARAVSGRIQQMQQKNADGPGGYDVATVVIEAPAQKVYGTAIQRLQAHSAQVEVIVQNAKRPTQSRVHIGERLTSAQRDSHPHCHQL
jgi:hypothetical protein